MELVDKIEILLSNTKTTKMKLSRETGIPYNTINSWFNRKTQSIHFKWLKKLSEYFGVDINYFTKDTNVTDSDYISFKNITGQFQSFKSENLLNEIESLKTAPQITEMDILLAKISSTLSSSRKFMLLVMTQKFVSEIEAGKNVAISISPLIEKKSDQ